MVFFICIFLLVIPYSFLIFFSLALLTKEKEPISAPFVSPVRASACRQRSTAPACASSSASAGCWMGCPRSAASENSYPSAYIRTAAPECSPTPPPPVYIRPWSMRTACLGYSSQQWFCCSGITDSFWFLQMVWDIFLVFRQFFL